jgi:hypothetical protein
VIDVLINFFQLALIIRQAGAYIGGPRPASEDRLVPRPLVQYPHALADSQSDVRPVFGGWLEDAARLVEAVAGIEHELDSRPVPDPPLDLVEVAAIGVARVVGLLVGPVRLSRLNDD